MNEKGLEDLLRSMPLKKPTRLPLTLAAGTGGKRSVLRLLWRIVSIRVPLWAAAAAVLLAMMLSLGTQERASEEEPSRIAPMPTGRAQGLPKSQQPTPAPFSHTRFVGTGRFWTLPDRYQEMLTAARRQGLSESQRRKL